MSEWSLLLNEIAGKRRGCDFVVDSLVEHGVDVIFGLPAESINALFDAARKNGGLQVITVRHEGNAALMASAFGKLAGRPAAVMATNGPGATHLVVGCRDAWIEGAPVVVVPGAVRHALEGTGAFQEVDSAALLSSMAASAHTATSMSGLARLGVFVARASARRAPVVLSVAPEVLTARTRDRPRPRSSVVEGIWQPEQTVLERAIRLLEDSERPAMLLGDLGNAPAGLVDWLRVLQPTSRIVMDPAAVWSPGWGDLKAARRLTTEAPRALSSTMPTWSSWSATCRPAGRLPDGLAHIVHLTDRPQTASLSDALVHSVCGAVPEALQVAALARRWAAPVVATMRGGPQVDTIPHFRGYVGSSGHVAANKLLRDADAVLVLGVSSRGAAFELLPPRASIVDVNTDPEPLHARGGDICLRADVATLVRQILDAPSSAPRDGRSAAAPDPREHDLLAAESTPTLRGELRPSFVIRVLDRCAEAHPGKVGWTADVGLNTLWLYRFRRSHRTTMWTGNFATMGFAVPAAVANSAHWGCPTIAVTGDGGAAMMLPALGKLRGGEPPVLVVVLNNSGLGAIRYEQEIMGWPEYNSAFCDSDFAQYAVASGWAGRRVTTAAELNAAVAEFFREPRPMLIDAVCSADEAPVPALLPSAPRVASMAFALRDGARPPPHSVVCGAAGTPRHPRTRTGAPNKHDRLVR